jgi:hypothetical protein
LSPAVSRLDEWRSYSRKAWNRDFLNRLGNHRCIDHAIPETPQHKLTGGRLASALEGWNAEGARNRVEYRYPFLDRRVIEFGLGLPPELYHRAGYNRWLLRESLADILPRAVRWHTSQRGQTLNRFRGRINRRFGDHVMRPLIVQLLAEDWSWQCLSVDGVRQIISSAENGPEEDRDGWWRAPLGPLRIEMLLNEKLKAAVTQRVLQLERSLVSG